MQKEYLRESVIKLLTLFVNWQQLRKWTFVKPITLTCHWWIYFICFGFNLSGKAVEKKIWPTICYLLCNGQKLVFWCGITFPYILDSGVYAWNDCQTMIYISVRGVHRTVCTKLCDIRWYISPAKDQPWKVPLQKDVILFPFCSEKWSKITKYTRKCESGITNVADKSINM